MASYDIPTYMDLGRCISVLGILSRDCPESNSMQLLRDRTPLSLLGTSEAWASLPS